MRLEHLGGDKWKVYIEVGPPHARVRRTRRFRGPGPTATGKPPRVVQTAARKFEVSFTQSRLHLEPQRVTFHQAAEAWWGWWVATQEHSPTTAHEYRRQLDRRLIPDLGDKLVERLTAGQLSDYYAQLRGTGLSAASVRTHHGRVRAILKHCVLHGWASRNVAGDAQLPSAPPLELHLPTIDQVIALVRAAEGQSATAGRSLVVSFGLGVRRGELAGLRRSSVRQAANEVLVDMSVTDSRSGRQSKSTKTHQARTVPMKPWVGQVLAAQLAAQADLAARLGLPLAADPYVWSLTPGGGRAPDPDYFTQVFTRARKAAGLERFRLHDLRHAFASWMLAEGVPLTEVSRLLGHGNTQTTARIYAHADPTGEGARAAIDRLPDIPARVEIVERRALPPGDDS